PVDVERASVSVRERTPPVISVFVWGELSERQVKVTAEEVRRELLAHPNVSLVQILDVREYEVAVDVSRERLEEYGLTLQDVSAAVRKHSFSASCGVVKTEGQNIAIRAVGRREEGPDFASIPVKTASNGEVITLGRLASIRDGFEDEVHEGKLNGHPGLRLYVCKAEGEDAITVARAVREYCETKQATLPPGIHLTPFCDETGFVRGQLRMLTKNGILGMAVVLLVLWVFLDARLSLWVAMGIPFSLSGALAVMWMADLTISIVTILAFIIMLGIIVDDAIVVGEAIYVHRRRGEGPLEAAVAGVSEVGMPVVAAALTTALAFLPLAFVPGDIGRLMSAMPPVAIAAILVSLAECLLLLPAHLNHLPDPNRAEHKGRVRAGMLRIRRRVTGVIDWVANRVYAPAARIAVRNRYVSLCAGVSVVLVAGGIFAGGWLKFIFWPPMDIQYLAADVEFPPGTPADVTRDAVERIREGLERVAGRQTTKSGAPFIVYLFSVLHGPEEGLVFTEIVDASDRTIHSQDFTAAWGEEVGQIAGATSQSFAEHRIHVGGWAPIEIRLRGKEIGALRSAADALEARLRSYDGVYEVYDDFRPGKTEFQVRLKPEAARLGLTLADVSAFLNAGYYGEEAIRIPRGREDVRVRVGYAEAERRTRAGLEQARIRTAEGVLVPLLSVADVEIAPGYAEIRGADGMRSIRVSANTDHKQMTPEEVIADLTAGYLDTLVAGYPDVSWTLSGASQSHRETLEGLKAGFVMAVLGIFAIMALVFRSYLQPFVIVCIIPFGIVGAIFGHVALGIPLTLLSVFGIVALAGVVVNDAIVLTECVNSLLAQGVPFAEAVCQGGVRRFRAILLTTLTTCAGVTPIILEESLQAQVVIPIAVSMAAGLAFATLVNLLLLPCMLTVLNDMRRLIHRCLHGVWPTAEAVEPALRRS
ncbi:MAG: efflux RND transporter permease subunit, partial [Candidatus Hydrogenedentes bacterium]|nr:efflux RND transporter permease subunit [Candidatus Hydrogenedentota bacterium]